MLEICDDNFFFTALPRAMCTLIPHPVLNIFLPILVAKYQTEDVKRTIIRLEQNAYSSMQRSIASHGAYAILYGRHSKHYIKKPEVILYARFPVHILLIVSCWPRLPSEYAWIV